MNERIRKLAREAGIKMAHDETLALGYLDTAHKKFAELIIQECVNVLYNEGIWDIRVSDTLNKHFRAEE